MRTITRTFILSSALAGLVSGAMADTNTGATGDTSNKGQPGAGMTSTESQGSEKTLQQVFFDSNAAKVKVDLLMTANQLQCDTKQTIILDGYADPSGGSQHNAELALRRAKAVRDLLVSY